MEVYFAILYQYGIVCDPVTTGSGAHGEEHSGVIPFELARQSFFYGKFLIHLTILIIKNYAHKYPYADALPTIC